MTYFPKPDVIHPKTKRNKRILDQYAQGKSERDIADDENVSKTTVNRVVLKRNVSQTDQDTDDQPPNAAYESMQETRIIVFDLVNDRTETAVELD